jgi:exosortase A-associated hydrolase 2
VSTGAHGRPFEPFFLAAACGERFCIFHPPAGAPRGAIIYLHPFGEEMNKARKMAALQSRRLAAAGHAVLQIDLFGCGDSSGDFGDARWEIWKQDVQTAARWLQDRVRGPISLWGLRLGATLAADIAREPGTDIEQLLLWQPVPSGEQFLTQFLRLRLAAEMLSAGAAQTGLRELRKTLDRGASLEIAGYELHPELASAIGELALAELIPAVTHILWLEVSAQPEPKVSPASSRVVEAWRGKGVAVRAAAVTGEPFWSTIEITDCEALLDATDKAISRR